MNIFELRLGNIVLVNGQKCRVSAIFEKDIEYTTDQIQYAITPIEKVEPVELTQDWFKAAGFELHRLRCVEKNGVRIYFWEKGTRFYFMGYEGATKTWVETVHHLQNLYFDLKNEELIFEAND